MVNYNEINSIKEDAINRSAIFLKQINQIPRYSFENLYESLRELAECIALIKGSKIYSHEELIKYLEDEQIIDRSEFQTFDSFRKTRNKSKYYGKDISIEKVKESIDDFKLIYNKLLEWVNNNS